MVALVAEDAKREEFRTPISVNKEQEVQAALAIDLEAIFDRVRDVDHRLDQVPCGAGLEILFQIREVQQPVGRREAVRGRMADRAQVVAHRVDQLTKLVDDFRF